MEQCCIISIMEQCCIISTMDSQYPHDMELKVPKKFKVKFSKDNGERRQIVKK